VPPRPVREFLELPTEERARAYLAWNQQRLDAIARATEVMKAVAISRPQRSLTSPGSTPGPATCIAPAESGPLRDPRFPEPGFRLAVPAPADRQLPGRGLAVVYAFASWCPYSARQTPIVAAWVRSRPDLRVVGLLLDSPPGADRQLAGLPFPVQTGSPALRDQLGVRGYPTILFLRDGVAVEAVSGVTPTDRLEAMARGLGA
jgi:thiol-disulfide isomerase/thioredoxin